MPEKPRDSPVYLVVGDRDLHRFSYVWKIWTHGTSFYLAPRMPALSNVKISLHGLDPAKGPPGYKIEVSDAPARTAMRRTGDWPDKGWFTGHRVHRDVDLVLRLRFRWDLFTSSRPSAPVPDKLPGNKGGLVVPIPKQMRSADVDFFVCHREPYWPNEQKARAANACLGPLRNAAGQYLTGVSVQRSPFDDPAPLTPPVPDARPMTVDDAVRGLRAAGDPRDFLWIEEQFISRAWLQGQGSEEAPT